MDDQPIQRPSEQPMTRRERRELQRQERRNQQTPGRAWWKQWWLWTLIGVVIVGGIVWLVNSSADTTNTVPVNAIVTDDHVRGDAASKALLIEYSDFQCPACAAYQPMLQQLDTEYGDRIAFVFRHYPLRTIHKNAQIGAQAGEAAGRQGKFWEMHDLLFEKQTEWSESADPTEQLHSYAQTLGLNIDQFTADLAAQATKDRIQRDVTSGNRARVPGTPTFFLNGKETTFQSYDALKSQIEAALAS